MDTTKKVTTNVPPRWRSLRPLTSSPICANFRRSPSKQWLAPLTVDTLYSSAFLDLSKEPIVMHLPDSKGRYYLMPILDAWTNVIASPGKRTTGTKEGDYAIVGPSWN